MIEHGFNQYQELLFNNLQVQDVIRRGQWIHVYITFELESMPKGLSEPSALVILNDEKKVIQMVVQDEGCDCEFKFTESEQRQILDFLQRQEVLEKL